MKKITENRYPPGWDEARVRDVLDHYEGQTEDEAVAEDEAAFAGATAMAVPPALVPRVRRLIVEHEAKKSA